MSNEPEPKRSGLIEVLLSDGAVDEKRLAHARRIHQRIQPPRPLLEVLKEMGLVTEESLREVLSRRRHEVRLGDLLVDLGMIERERLEEVLELQSGVSEKRLLGDILLDERIIEEDQLYRALSMQLGCPVIRPLDETPDATLLADVPEAWGRRHGFFPLRRQDDGVVIAFTDPFEESSVAEARRIFGDDPVTIVLCTPADLAEAWASVASGAARSSDAPTESDIVALADKMITDASDRDASDIHIESLPDRLRVRFREDGVLVPYRDFSRSLCSPFISRLKVMCKADISERRRHQDGRLVFERDGYELDLRASFYITVHGEKVVLRLLKRDRPLLPIDSIGIPPMVLERFKEGALNLPSGVILVTGPTGSGKTTTLYSAIHHINSEDIAIITAEDPVEYVIDGIAQCSLDPEIERTYEETLRHIVRQDPDVIVIGEIRDEFSAETAIQAALTGHKVITTFHTEDTIGGLIRLLNMNIEAFLISSTVVSVIAQRLVRRICENCAMPHTLTSVDLRRLGYVEGDLAGAKPRKGRGCSECRRTGYRGREAIFELLVLGDELREAILEHRTSHEIRRISRERSGLVSLLEDGIVKAADGITTFDEVLRTLPRLDPPRPLAELRRLLGV